MIHHVVFYKLKPSAKGNVEEICERTRKMAVEIGALRLEYFRQELTVAGLAESFVTGPPTPDTVQAAQGYDIMVRLRQAGIGRELKLVQAVSTYKDKDSLDRYNSHELHQEFIKWNKVRPAFAHRRS